MKRLSAFLLGALAWGADPWGERVQPSLLAHCASCHGDKAPAGGLSIPALLAAPTTNSPTQRERWERIAARIRAGEMPPPGAPRPAPPQLAAIAQQIEAAYEALDRARPVDPGRVTARRLNRFEYANSVRDLLGLDLNPAEDLPTDPYGYGFDSIGDVLSVNSALMDQYLKAAERIARLAIPVPGETVPATMQRYLAERIGQDRQLRLTIDHVFPIDGLYTLRTAFYQALKDGTRVRLRLTVDGQPAGEGELRFYYQIDRGLTVPQVRVPAGRHRVEATLTVLPDPPYKGAPPYLESVEVFGPLPAGQRPDRRLLTCAAAPGPACARQILLPLARRAWRRPLSTADTTALLGLAAREQARTGSFEQAMRTALTAILLSPHFLFRLEQDRGPRPQPVSPHELATRLAYFLWGSLPDAELSRLADAGALPTHLEEQTRRLLAHPRSTAFIENFAGQWLQTRNLAVLKPDAKLFPAFTGELAAAMRTETELFFAEILRENRSILDLLDAPFTYLNEPLAKHYGIEGVRGEAFRRVALDGVRRGGVLTHASVLTVSSYPTRTSPVIRGKWILDNLLNQPPPPPPPNVPALEEKAAASGGSMRQQLAQHRSNPSCAACHTRMDPLGFGLENYDAIGRWRDEDASGELPGGVRFTTPAEMKQILKADPDVFARALTEKMLTYALGRGVELSDRPAVRLIVDRLRTNGYRMHEVILGIVESEPFRKRRGEGGL
jgi:mono/diheme cytochrome c family protein